MISKKEVQHIAKLARLRLTEKEIISFQKELSKILDYFNLLKEVSLKTKKTKKDFLENIISPVRGQGVSEETQGKQTPNGVREDSVKKQSPETINKLFKAAPKKEKGYIKVKAIL